MTGAPRCCSCVLAIQRMISSRPQIAPSRFHLNRVQTLHSDPRRRSRHSQQHHGRVKIRHSALGAAGTAISGGEATRTAIACNPGSTGRRIRCGRSPVEAAPLTDALEANEASAATEARGAVRRAAPARFGRGNCATARTESSDRPRRYHATHATQRSAAGSASSSRR